MNLPASAPYGDPSANPGGSGRLEGVQGQAIVIGAIVALLWAVEIVDVAVRHRLDRFGVQPHTVRGLRGVALAPFLHSGFGHLIGNTIPFAVMGFIVLTGGLRRFVAVSLVVAVVSGLGMWLFGSSNEVHIGASGIVFGYLGYLLSRGFFEDKIGQIAVGVLVGVVYGGMIWGVLPTARGVSWQGHLFGFLGGMFAARMLAPPQKDDAEVSPA